MCLWELSSSCHYIKYILYTGVGIGRESTPTPTISNFDQHDTDRDGLGDVGDQEESRFTERHGWIPWVVFGGVFLLVAGMGYEVIRNKRKGV